VGHYRHDYNRCQSHGRLGNMTSSEYRRKHPKTDLETPNSSFLKFEKRTNVNRGQALSPTATQKSKRERGPT
jgi:hypothetical protein